MSGASIELLKRQINDEYYRGNKSLKTICERYYWLDEEDIKKALGIYDLKREDDGKLIMSMAFRKDWEKACRKLNPKAWEGR